MKNCTLIAGPFPPKARRCDFCGKALAGQRKRWCSDRCSKDYWNNHVYRFARKVAKRRDKYKCVTCGSKYKLEVNHIRQCWGAHGKQSCYHHIENLETLCCDCHRKVTNAQNAKSRAKKKATRKKKK